METNPQQQSAGQSQGNQLLGQAIGLGYCPHCAPKCPCCGRPYGNYGYPYYHNPVYGQGASLATMQANGINSGGQSQ